MGRLRFAPYIWAVLAKSLPQDRRRPRPVRLRLRRRRRRLLRLRLLGCQASLQPPPASTSPMAPTRRRNGSVSTLPQVCHGFRPLPRRRRLGSPLPPLTSSSAKNPTPRRGRSASHPATRIPPDGSSSCPRRGSPVAPIANAMKLRAIESGGGGSMGLRRERSSLEPHRAGSAETLDPSSSSVEAMDAGDEEVVPSGKHAPLLPPHLLKFLKDEGENAREDEVRLLAMVVHVLFLDNGFVSFDSLQHGWAASITTGTLKLRYTLPSLLHGRSNSMDSIELRFETRGKLVRIYGRVPGNGSRSVTLFLDTSRRGVSRPMYLGEDLPTQDEGGEEDEVVEVLKMRLLLPLHIDICDKAGLPLPPCFMRLPTAIHMKILALLPWWDLAKMACVCSEMRRLASDDELWKQRYGEEVLGEVGMAGARERSWKDMFGVRMRRRKKMMEGEMARRRELFCCCG